MPLTEIGFLVVIAIWLLSGIRIVNEHEQGMVLRLGRFAGVRGAGVRWVVPLLDTMIIVDTRRPPLQIGGAPALAGATGEALSDVRPDGGVVRIDGEYWHARSTVPIRKGSRVRAAAVDDQTVTIVSVEPGAGSTS